MPCQIFASPAAAFARVLTNDALVLAVGETHAPRDATGIPSATHRFTAELLPALEGRATDLVLELWIGNGGCGKEEKKVAAQQREVTETQAPTNQNEFVTLAEEAKKRGLRPHVLTPTCDEYARILDAGAGDIDVTLTMIARLTGDQLAEGVDKARGKLIVAYGGAMHNDASPRAGHEAWSFGPRVIEKTGGRYVELDLIVPELVKDTEAWRAQPWYAHYDPRAHDAETLLLSTGPRSYALIFPKTNRP